MAVTRPRNAARALPVRTVTRASQALLASGAAALVTGIALWKLWWWAGYPAGAFTPGLDGHGPDPYAWPRLLALWIPAGHVLFALAYALLARWDPRGCSADSSSPTSSA